MSVITETVLVALGGGAFGFFSRAIVQHFKSGDARHGINRKADVELEQHRDQLMLELIDAARNDAKAARDEAAVYRPMLNDMTARLAHFEEALDHIHALISSGTPEERAAAERRAAAFLRRMRGDEEVGQERLKAQRKISIKRAVKDIERKEGL